jgi:hypothetical protein
MPTRSQGEGLRMISRELRKLRLLDSRNLRNSRLIDLNSKATEPGAVGELTRTARREFGEYLARSHR